MPVRRGPVDVIKADRTLGDQLQRLASRGEDLVIDAVAKRGYQDLNAAAQFVNYKIGGRRFDFRIDFDFVSTGSKPVERCLADIGSRKDSNICWIHRGDKITGLVCSVKDPKSGLWLQGRSCSKSSEGGPHRRDAEIAEVDAEKTGAFEGVS